MWLEKACCLRNPSILREKCISLDNPTIRITYFYVDNDLYIPHCGINEIVSCREGLAKRVTRATRGIIQRQLLGVRCEKQRDALAVPAIRVIRPCLMVAMPNNCWLLANKAKNTQHTEQVL
jgi:hypothetical protein